MFHFFKKHKLTSCWFYQIRISLFCLHQGKAYNNHDEEK